MPPTLPPGFELGFELEETFLFACGGEKGVEVDAGRQGEGAERIFGQL